MGGVELEETKEEKYVDVLVSEDLKPLAQRNRAANRANAALGQLSRAVHYRDKNVFMDLYKTHVRPHLEYTVKAWAPHLKKDQETLEKVLKKTRG